MSPTTEVSASRTAADATAACDPALAAALRRLRLRRGMTQERLAVEAGVTTSAYARIERGLADPHWTTIRRLTNTLDVSLAELATAIEREAPEEHPTKLACSGEGFGVMDR